MDSLGWRASRKAAREDQQFEQPQRLRSGHFIPVERLSPLHEPFIGGYLPPGAAPPYMRRPSAGISTTQLSRTSARESNKSASTSISRTSTALERSRYLRNQAPPRMNPHLQVMCGPLLRYDSVDAGGNYRGACLIVTADAGSVYEPYPQLTLEWDPERPRPPKTHGLHNRVLSTGSIGPKDIELSSSLPPVLAGVPLSFPEYPTNSTPVQTPSAQKDFVSGQEIWVYDDGNTVRYRVNQGPEYEFVVPGRNQNMRWAGYSCNGFSTGVNPDEFRGPGFFSGNDPVWMDLLAKHSDTPFHVLVGGGDQLYCDKITREPELQEWINTKDPSQKKVHPLTDEVLSAIDRFYFNHYCIVFRTGAFARAISSIPMANMLDDHDIIDGFGSYPADLQTSPIFSGIGSRGYFFFLLFQCFIVTTVDGVDRKPNSHTFRSTIIGGDGAYVPFPSHSMLTYMGPKVWMLMLDCRAERRKDQVCSPIQYQLVQDALYRLPAGVEHLIVQLGIPIAYPRLNFLEGVLQSKFNLLVALGRTGSLGLSSLVNKFNAEAELLDDLNDHWTAKGHKGERNWFIQRMQEFARIKHLRVSFLSGDVHCAAVGVFKTLTNNKDPGRLPTVDHRYMLNIISSAIVNTPPPGGVVSMVSALAEHRHRTMHYAQTDETMVPLFEKDPNGHTPTSKHIMARRNWCSTQWDETTGDLVFDIRVEREQGVGETVGYPIRAPPPRWD